MTRRGSGRSTPSAKTTPTPSSANVVSRGKVFLFVLVLVVLVVLGSVIELFMIRNNYGGGLRVAIAKIVAGMLKLLTVPASVDGTTVHVASGQIDIAVECTGIRATAIFWAGVLAFPCSWRSRGFGILMGLVGVGLLNILRIASLGLVAGYRYEWFETVHALLMQGFLVVFVAPLWIAWMAWAIKRDLPDIRPPSKPKSQPA